jgi:hypothetical protein
MSNLHCSNDWSGRQLKWFEGHGNSARTRTWEVSSPDAMPQATDFSTAAGRKTRTLVRNYQKRRPRSVLVYGRTLDQIQNKMDTVRFGLTNCPRRDTTGAIDLEHVVLWAEARWLDPPDRVLADWPSGTEERRRCRDSHAARRNPLAMKFQTLAG